MSSALQVGTHSLKYQSPETPYAVTQAFTPVVQDAEEIVPYLTRAYSPIRVTHYRNSNMHVKRKSKVDEVSRSTVFNLRPMKRGDKVTAWNRFRSPEATLPSLRYIPPWVSITKSDYIDPRLCTESEMAIPISPHPQPLVRSHTDINLATPRLETPRIDTPATPAISVTSLPVKTPKSQILRTDSRMTTKTMNSEKKVKIIDPMQNGIGENQMMVSSVTPRTQKVFPTPNQMSPAIRSTSSPKIGVKNVKLPDTGINYYSGYLPPELSDKIAEELRFKSDAELDDITKQNQFVSQDGQFYKPLVGDRTWFMKVPYPTKPKIYQSDIDQIRFEGHKRLVQSNGQAPAHYSVLNKNGTSIRPFQNGVILDEAARTQQRQAKSAAPASKRMPQVSTSLDLFERQREKTYHLQSLAKEMLNK